MLSIITPHYNDFDGILRLYNILVNQKNKNFEWIIIDDVSNRSIKNKILKLQEELSETSFVKIVFSKKKLYASGARNLGVMSSTFNYLVFVDSDDVITTDFVGNRIKYLNFDFVIFLNFKVIKNYSDTEGKNFSSVESNFLESFLSTKFPWQTSAVVIKKSFYNEIEGFNQNLILLEDILLSIKCLCFSNNYKPIVDNDIDFYYFSKPISSKSRNYLKVNISVEKFIEEVLEINSDVLKKKNDLLSSYYFLACRYFLKDKLDLNKLKRHVTLLYFFKQKRLINSFEFFSGLLTFLFIFDKNLYLKLNRKLFKKTNDL